MNQNSHQGSVLYVEDHIEQCESLSMVLKLAGFAPYCAGSGEAALEIARSKRDELDVLIVDYHLSADETGTEVAESVARLLGRALPTVILTGDPANAEFPLLTHAPVWLMRKPAIPELLAATLPSLVSFHRAAKSFTARSPDPR